MQPQTVVPGKITAHGGKFQLQPAILVPCALNTRAVNHPVFTKQSSGFIPLATGAMRQSILIAFLVGQHAVLVPDTDNAMPETIAQRHYFTQLAIPVKGFFNRLFHKPGNVSFGNEPI